MKKSPYLVCAVELLDSDVLTLGICPNGRVHEGSVK